MDYSTLCSELSNDKVSQSILKWVSAQVRIKHTHAKMKNGGSLEQKNCSFMLNFHDVLWRPYML